MDSQLGGDVYKSGGMTDTLHGCSYQLKLLMLFMHQGIKQNYKFKLASEMEDAEKLDDLVFSYEEKGRTIHRLVQAKHKKDTTKTISKSEMVAEDGDFSLLRYFTSLRQIKPKEQFQGDVKDIIICTNIDLEKQIKHAFYPIEDNIFDFSATKPKAQLMKIKTKSPFAKDLRKILKEKHVNTIARELLKRKGNNDFPKNTVFTLYESWLLENVLDEMSESNVNFVKLRNEFPEQCNYVRDIFQSMRAEFGDKEVKWCLGKNKLKKSKQPLQLPVDDKEIDEYFDKLVIAINQPNEKELSDILKDLITEERSHGTDAELIVSQLLQYVLDWNNKDRLRFQRTQDIEKVLLNIQQMLACHAAKGTTEMFKQKYKKTYSFKSPNQVIEEVVSFLNQDQVNVLKVVYRKSSILCIMKILQAIGDNTRDDILCDSDTLDHLTSGPACLIKAFDYDLCRLLVVNVNSKSIKTTKENIRCLINSAKTGKKKLIIIIPCLFEPELHSIIHNKIDYITIVDFENNMQNFNQESRTQFLNNSIVQFQDRDVPLRAIVTETSTFIKNEILSKLVCKQEVKIGKSISDKNYEETKDYFIERYLTHFVEVEQCIIDEENLFLIVNDASDVTQLKIYDKKDVILISDSESDFKTLCDKLKNNVHWLRSIYSWQKTHNTTNKISTGNFESCDVILLISDDDSDTDIIAVGEKYPDKNIRRTSRIDLKGWFNDCPADPIVNLICSDEETYNELRELYPKLVIHWYSWNRKLCWHRTRGRLDRLWKYVNQEGSYSYSESVPASQVSERVVVVSAEPGMGKTTLMTHVAMNVNKSSDASQLWVVKVNLINYFDVFKNMKSANIGLDESIHFLLRTLKLGYVKDDNDSLILIRDLVVIEDGMLILKDNKLEFDGNDLLDLNVFIHCYNSGKVVVTFDGYDEACPDYKQVVLDLITILLNVSKIKMMWISSRPYNIVDELQIKCSVFKYLLTPLKNLFEFFLKFWSTRLKNVSDDHCKKFVDRLLETLSKNLNRTSISDVSSFVSVPLHLKIIATVYEKTFQSYCLDDVNHFDEEVFKKFSLFQLYDKFWKSKFMILGLHESDEESNDDDTRHNNNDKLTKIKAIKNAKKLVRDTSLDNHKILALRSLYEEDKLRLFLPTTTLEKIKNLTATVAKSEEETGIIGGVTANGQPHFIHRTFAEYFASIYFFDMLMKKNTNAKDFFYQILTEKDSTSSVLFQFFNYKCVEDSCYLLSAMNGVQIIIERDNQINGTEQSITDLYNRTAFHLTASDIDWREFPAVFSVEQPALMLKDNLFGWTPLHYAAVNHQCRDYNVRESGIPWPHKVPCAQAVNVQDEKGASPVMLSFKRHCRPSCILLYYMMKSKPLFDLRDHRGRTALHLLLDNYVGIHERDLLEFIDRCSSYDALIEDDNGESAIKIAEKNKISSVIYRFQKFPKKTLNINVE